MRDYFKSEHFRVVMQPWVATLFIYGVCFPPLATGWVFYVKNTGFLSAVGQIYVIGIPLSFCMGAMTMAFVWRNKRDTLWEGLTACGAVFMVAIAFALALLAKEDADLEFSADLASFIFTFVLASLVALLCWWSSRPFRREWVAHLQKGAPT